MKTIYHFCFLGSPQVEKANQPLSAFNFGSRKGLALLAYLACHQKPVSRSYLADLFWPDKPELRGRRNLSRELSQLSTYLPGCLEGNTHEVQFKPGEACWLDIWEFEALTQEITLPELSTLQDFEETERIEPTQFDFKTVPAPDPAKLIAAAELYRGDFLAGLYLDGCPDFESWLVKEQEFWRQRIIALLDWLFSYFALRRQDDQARKYLERWLALEPWNEDAHRYLMILLARNGQRGTALAQYERCRRALAEELGVDPSAKTVALYEQIRTGELIEKPVPTPPPSITAREVNEPPGLIPSGDKPVTDSLPPHNLPAPIKSFLGREEELNDLITYLQNPEVRLVTLVGLGGMGKTEMALQAARLLLPCFRDGIWLVSLASVQAPQALPPETPEVQADRFCQTLATAIATALGLTLRGDRVPQEQVKAYLGNKTALLVVDNFEHLIEGAAFLEELLAQAGRLKLLVTSRERLRLPGEWILELEGLPYPSKPSIQPDWGAPDLPDPESYWRSDVGLRELADFAAVSLFVERARQGRATFTLSPQNSAAVVRLCQLVEGMPLGLELLASQVRGFMPEQIIQTIEANLSHLQTDLRTVPARHRSLHAVFEWSWSLLSPMQQHLLSQLSVFRGGFEVAAAQAVVGDVTWPDLLELWDRALLRRHKSGRLEMHELLKQFAQEKLALYEAAYTGEPILDRHSRYYMTLVSRWEADILNEVPKQALVECRLELDNIRQAWQWAINQNRFEWIVHALTAISSIYDLLGLFREAIAILEAAIARVKVREAAIANPTEAEMLYRLWGRLLVEQGHFLYEQARHDRLAEIAQTLIQLGERSGLEALTAAGYLQGGKARLGQGDYEAGQQDLEQSLALAQRAQLPRLVADSLYFLGIISHYQGQRVQAGHYFEQALDCYRQQGHQQGEEDTQSWLLTFLSNQDYARSKAYFEQRLTIARQRANPINQARLLHLLAQVCMKVGEYHQARIYEEESWTIAENLHRPWFITTRLNGLSAIAYYLNEPEVALKYGYQALEAAKALKSPLIEGLVLTTLGHILLAQGKLAEAAGVYEQALALHQAQNKQEAAMETLASLAKLALTRHDLSQAQAYVEEISGYLDRHDLEHLDEPFFISLACYRVLQASQDPRAKLVLSRAYRLLQTQADRISEALLRRSFLEQVAVNHEIVLLQE